jgi:DNA-binding NarL/FixJ family response regulator
MGHEGMQRSPVIDVALVDDDPHYRGMFASAVQEHPEMALVHVAATGLDMLGWLDDHRPDVLLVDLGLPDVPGLEIVKFGAMRWPQMSIAVVTLFSDEPHVMACLEAGAMGYILKQSPALDVSATILDIANGGSPMSPFIARYVLQRLRQSTKTAKTEMSSPKVEQEPAVLTVRELSILDYVARGFRVSEVAQLLGIQASTVSSHLKSIYVKLAVHSKTEAVYEAVRMGWIASPSPR